MRERFIAVKSSNLDYSERLDHLRFFAALSVISFHATHTIYRGLINSQTPVTVAVNPLSVFFVEGHTAVGLFLTLSGFLFARICQNKFVDFKQFYLNRLLRIYPLYLSALMLSMCVVPASFVEFLTSLFTFNTLPDALKGIYVDHLWSIGVEIQFYLVFPILLLAYRKSGMRYLFHVVALTVLILGCIQLSTGATRDVAYGTILGRLNQAVIGMMLGFSFDRIRRYLRNPMALLSALTLVSCALQWFHAQGGMPGTGQNPLWIFWLSLEALVWGLVICCYQACAPRLPAKISNALAAISNGRTPITNALAAISNAFAYLGSMSYSIYVNHYFLTCGLCAWFVNLMAKPHHRHPPLVMAQEFMMAHPLETSLLAGTFLILPPTLLLSFLTFNVIERPFMGLRRKYVLPVEQPETVVETNAEFSSGAVSTQGANPRTYARSDK